MPFSQLKLTSRINNSNLFRSSDRVTRFVSELEVLVLQVSLGATAAKERLFHAAAASVVPCHVDHSSPDPSCAKGSGGSFCREFEASARPCLPKGVVNLDLDIQGRHHSLIQRILDRFESPPRYDDTETLAKKSLCKREIFGLSTMGVLKRKPSGLQ